MTPSIFAIGNKDARVLFFAVPITCRAEPLTVPKTDQEKLLNTKVIKIVL